MYQINISICLIFKEESLTMTCLIANSLSELKWEMELECAFNINFGKLNLNKSNILVIKLDPTMSGKLLETIEVLQFYLNPFVTDGTPPKELREQFNVFVGFSTCTDVCNIPLTINDESSRLLSIDHFNLKYGFEFDPKKKEELLRSLDQPVEPNINRCIMPFNYSFICNEHYLMMRIVSEANHGYQHLYSQGFIKLKLKGKEKKNNKLLSLLVSDVSALNNAC